MQSKVVYRHKDVYTDVVDGHLMVFRPNSARGIYVLDKPSAFVYGLIDNKRTLGDIISRIKKKDKRVTNKQAIDLIKKLITTGLVYSEFYSYNKQFPQKKRLSVWFHLTNQCNFRCTYCHVSKTPENMSHAVGERAIDKLLIDGKKNKFETIQISFAGGEPLLEFRNLQHFVEYAKKKAKQVGITVEFAMTTNASLITENVAAYIARHKIATAISLDGLGAFNDAQRVFVDKSGTFKYIERGLKLLQKHGITVYILTTITKHNIAHLKDLFNYCYDNKIIFGTNLFRDNPCAPNGDLAMDQDLAIHHLKKTFKVAFERVNTIEDSHYFHQVLSSVLDRVQITKAHMRACGVGYSYMTISQKGLISACPMTLDTPIGSMDDKDIIHTMNTKTFIAGKKEIIEESPGCKQCRWKYICCGGCPLAYYGEKSKPKVPDYCKLYKTLIPDLLRIEARRLIKWGK